MNPSTWEPFKAALEASPLCTLSGEQGAGYTRTIDITHIDENTDPQTAQATITWTNASGATKRSALRLILQPAPRGDPEWRISHLETDTS